MQPVIAQSNNLPKEIEKIGNKIYRNFNIKEIQKEDEISYEYCSMVFDSSVSEEAMERDVKKCQIQLAKKYLEETAWYVERYNDPSSKKDIPEDVLEQRGVARDIINDNEEFLIGLINSSEE